MGNAITRQMGKAGDESAGAFGDTFKKRLRAALDSLPKATIDANSTPAERKVAELRAQLEKLANEPVIDSKKAMIELDKIGLELGKVARKADGIEVKFNIDAARVQLALLKRDVDNVGSGGGGGILSRLGGLFGGGGAPPIAGLAQGGQAAAAGGSGLLSNPYVLAGGGIAAAVAAPFVGQAIGGTLTAGLGAGLAGMGVAGAFGVGAQTAAQIATARIQLQSSQAAAGTAQANLNKLQASGKATATQLAAATASLASAQNRVVTQQKALGNMSQITAGQQAVRQAFSDTTDAATASLRQIGVSFIPVMESIFSTAQSVMAKVTPVFATAVKAISGPFQSFVNTILKAFTDPAVTKSIQDVANAFGDILKAFTPDIPGIAKSLAEAISRMANAIAANPKAFADFLNFLFQIVIALIDAIAWLTVAANYIEQHFIPAIKDVSKWFQQVGHDVEHYWDMMWNNTIVRMERGLHDIAHGFDDLRHDIAHVWDLIWNNTIGREERGVNDMVRGFDIMRHDIAHIYDLMRHDIAVVWDLIWNNTVGRAIRGWHDLETVFINLKNWILNFFGSALNWLARSGTDIMTGLWHGLVAGWNFVSTWFGRIYGWITGFFNGAVNWLYNSGHDVISGMWSGIKAAWNDVVGWFKGMPHAILHALGIASPPKWAVDAGKHIMDGLLKGMAHGVSDVKGFFVHLATDVTGPLKSVWRGITGVGKGIGRFVSNLLGFHGGGGVAQWAGTVSQALGMLGLPQSLSGDVLYQMQTESGGNPNAINNWDINAQQGDPSRGLMQVIGGTFAAYHVPGTSSNIYDPLANIAAALNYAMHNRGFGSGPGQVGSGHGYDDGGWWPPGTFGWNTSRQPELVVTQQQLKSGGLGGSQGSTYIAHFDGLTRDAIESHVRIAYQAMALQEGSLQRNGRKS
jgi:hypothetical protein